MCSALTVSTAHAEPASPEGEAAIWNKMYSLGWEQYLCWEPMGTPQKTPDGVGAYLGFWTASGQVLCAIYWSPTTQAHVIYMHLFERFANVGYEVGVGYPVMDPAPTPDGRAMYTWTQKPNGELTGIYWNPELGGSGYDSFHFTSFTVKPPVVSSWAGHGWETGKGYPATQLMTNNTVGNGCWLTNNTGCTPANYGQVQLFKKYDSAGNVIGQNCACINYGGAVNWVTIY
jgi:hypothetical protein